MRRHLLTIALLLAAWATIAAQTGDLPRSAPEAQGVPQAVLDNFLNTLDALPEVDIHHLMLVRHGQVIAERHAAPYRADDLHMLYSASKTVMGLAVGLAVDDGLLSISDKVSKYLRDKMPTPLPASLDSLTVRDVLTMTTGRHADLGIFVGNGDWLTAWFAGQFEQVGKRFEYDSMCTHALAVIVSRLTGKPVIDYVRERLFVPMHITDNDWEVAPDSVEIAGWGLRLHAESEAKLGLLMLNNGNWEGQQLVSSQWIHDMTQRLVSTEKPRPPLPLKQRIIGFLRSVWHTIRSWFTGYNIDDYYLGYGLHVKTILQPRSEAFFAAGYGGQLIYVVPKLDLVLVINGRAENYGGELNVIYYQLIEPLVADEVPDGDVPQPTPLAIERPEGDPTHPVEAQMLGRRIELEDNLLGINDITVNRQGNDRLFTMTDVLGPLYVVATCGEWRFTTSNERPIYIGEGTCRLVGTQGPFTSIAAYGWQGDTLQMRVDWLGGGDNRRLKMVFDGDNVTVYGSDNFDPLLTDTIHGIIQPRP